MKKYPENFNNLDRFVKASIMRHPIIFPSRIEVLEHLFMTNGNGYEWNFETGDIESAFNHDIYEYPEKIGSTQIEKSKNSEHIGTLFSAVKHQFIEDNIDEIASTRFGHYTCEIDIHSMSKHFLLNYSLIGILLRSEEPLKINYVWRAGIIELAEWYIQQVRQFYSLFTLDNRSTEEEYIESKNIRTVFVLFKSLNALLLSKEEQEKNTQKEQVRNKIAKDIAKRIIEKENQR